MPTTRQAQFEREERFIDAYIGAANRVAWQAAKLAGYKGGQRTLEVLGSRVLARPSVRARIDQRCKNSGVESAKVLETLELHRSCDIFDVFDITAQGGLAPNWPRLKAAQRAGVVHKVKINKKTYLEGKGEDATPVTEETVEVWLHNSQSAAVELGKILGMYIERREVIETKPPTYPEMIEKFKALGIPEVRWPPGLVAYHKRHNVTPA